MAPSRNVHVKYKDGRASANLDAIVNVTVGAPVPSATAVLSMEANRSALVIATDRYHDDRLQPLATRARKVSALLGPLRDPAIGRFQAPRLSPTSRPRRSTPGSRASLPVPAPETSFFSTCPALRYRRGPGCTSPPLTHLWRRHGRLRSTLASSWTTSVAARPDVSSPSSTVVTSRRRRVDGAPSPATG